MTDTLQVSASTFDGEPHDIDVPTQAADALALIDALSPDEPAYVFGSSGGAITGLELVTRHPERVRLLVAHEPPCTTVLPDAAERMSADDPIMTIYREQGPAAAMMAFLQMGGLELGAPDAEPTPEQQEFFARMAANFDVFFGQMWAGIGAFVPDVDALRARPVVVAVGAASEPHAAERSARELAAQLGTKPVEMVGQHVGFADDPERFAEELQGVLATSGTPVA